MTMSESYFQDIYSNIGCYTGNTFDSTDHLFFAMYSKIKHRFGFDMNSGKTVWKRKEKNKNLCEQFICRS